jgi:hypothetical protein
VVASKLVLAGMIVHGIETAHLSTFKDAPLSIAVKEARLVANGRYLQISHGSIGDVGATARHEIVLNVEFCDSTNVPYAKGYGLKLVAQKREPAIVIACLLEEKKWALKVDKDAVPGGKVLVVHLRRKEASVGSSQIKGDIGKLEVWKQRKLVQQIV